MGTISGNDRRRSERAEHYDFTLNLSSGGKAITDVQLRDVSADGFGVQVGGDLSVGQKLRFELLMPGGSVSGAAAVVWAEPFHMGYRGGAKFVGLGWFGRRRLRRALNGAGAESWADVVLVVVAVALGAMVAVDLALHPGLLKAALAKLQSLAR